MSLRTVADEFDTHQGGTKWSQTFRAPHLDTGAEEEPLNALRLAATIVLLFLILYLVDDVAILTVRFGDDAGSSVGWVA